MSVRDRWSISAFVAGVVCFFLNYNIFAVAPSQYLLQSPAELIWFIILSYPTIAMLLGNWDGGLSAGSYKIIKYMVGFNVTFLGTQVLVLVGSLHSLLAHIIHNCFAKSFHHF